jgi:hypothetical protein
MDELERLTGELLKALDSTDVWTERVLADPAVRPAERETIYSLRRYMAEARIYAYSPDPVPAELVRRRQKVERNYWTILLKWRESGRR